MRRFFPFNAEQTVNILSEFGPLVTMFVVNALFGITAGTWALILTTLAAVVAMRIVLQRLPMFPLIASSVTVAFGGLALITGDPVWVQIKVTIFNAMFAIFLFAGLALKRNFFKYVFEKTFHYSEEGWYNFTWSFAWFFVFTAVLNEVIRLSFDDVTTYSVLGYEITGINIWILFKVAFIMPLSGLYAWYLTRLMYKYRLPAGEAVEAHPATSQYAILVAERGAKSPSRTAGAAQSQRSGRSGPPRGPAEEPSS